MIKEAIILAGGFGTRLQHIVNDVPKPMAPINNEPFLSFLFRRLIAAGIEHVILSTGYLHEKIEDHYGNCFESLHISYSRETDPLGTGGAIKLALSKAETDTFLVLNGDTLFDINFTAFEKFHQSNNSIFSLALREVDDVARYGSVNIGAKGKVQKFSEKNEAQGQGLINGGIYLINRELFSKISLPESFSFEKEVMEKYYTQFDFYGLDCQAYFIDIGVPEDYYRAQEEFPKLNF